MWIQIPEHLTAINHPEFDERQEFGDKTKVQVSKDVGELLIEQDDRISEHTKED